MVTKMYIVNIILFLLQHYSSLHYNSQYSLVLFRACIFEEWMKSYLDHFQLYCHGLSVV